MAKMSHSWAKNRVTSRRAGSRRDVTEGLTWRRRDVRGQRRDVAESMTK